jgi:D-lactate dehydrogenase
LGTGTIGTAFASIMRGFGAKVIASDPVQSSVASALGVQYVTQDELLGSSDIVSIHCPLNTKTRSMIAAPQLAMMKKGAFLINTSRGAIINTGDVIESLEQGHLGGACLDVYEKERNLFFEDHRNLALDDEVFARLRAHRNVIVTGHQAFLTAEALTGIANTTVTNLDCWNAGTASPYEIGL